MTATSYHSVSGYLVAELPNNSVLSFYKVVSKKMWFVLDDRHCALMAYDGPDKINGPTTSTIELKNTTITIEPTADNVFNVNGNGKEYKLIAANHEAMMVWVQAIQTLRGLSIKSAIGANWNSSNTSDHRRIKRSQSLATMKAEVPRRLPQVTSGDSIAECEEEDPAKTRSQEELVSSRISKSADLQSSGDRSVNFVIADITMRSGSQLRPVALSLSASDSFAAGAFRSLRSGSIHSANKATPRVSEENENNEKNTDNANSPASPSETSIDYDAMVDGEGMPMKNSLPTDGAVDNEVLTATETDSANDTSRMNSSDEEVCNRIRLMKEKLEQSDITVSMLTAQLEKREKDVADMDERVHILEMQLKQSQEANARVNKPAARRFSFFGGNAGATENGSVAPPSASEDQLIESCKILTNKNQFLNNEIKRLELMNDEQRERVKAADEKIEELNEDIARGKLEHLKTLQCALLCLVLNPRSCSIRDADTPPDGMKMLFKAVDTAVCEQLDLTRVRNPALPTMEVLTTPNKFFVDKYGFKHTFCTDETAIADSSVDGKSATLETYQMVMNRLDMLVYVSSQLYLHHAEVVAAQARMIGEDDVCEDHWKKQFSKVTPSTLRSALRQAVIENSIPQRFRSDLWRVLIRNAAPIHQKLKKLGPFFYSILAKQAQEDQNIYSNKYARQIAVDLLRTMPSNVRYESLNSDKIKMLSEVLLTFLRYNSTIGYYQGMNFIAANALLFLEKENSFWLLVALTEHFFRREQFFPDLIGLQADQMVLKELIEAKLPRLHAHFKQIELDVEVISFTWFATLFFNALRFETLLRIWDCFLMDGRKFLFRVSLALLKLHEDLLLEQTDALAAWRTLKLANQTVVAVEQLIDSAYHDFEPFPKRKLLDQKQSTYIEQLRKTLNIKISEKQQFIQMEAELRKVENRGALARNRDIYYRACPVVRNHTVWLSYGDGVASRLALVEVESGEVLELDGDFDAEVTAMCTVNARSSSIVLVGFSNGRLCAFDYKSNHRLWYIRVRDSILSCIVVYCDRLLSSSLPAVARVFCGTADGSLAVMEIFRFSCEPAVFYVNLSQSPITALLHLPQLDMLLCAAQDKLHTAGASALDRRRLHELRPSSADEEQLTSNNKVAYHRKHIAIMQLVRDVGVCVVRKYSSVLEFYAVSQARMKATSVHANAMAFASTDSRKSELTFKPLHVYDISQDSMGCASRHASGEANLRALHYRITAVLPLDDVLWVGSSCGETFVYETVLDKGQTQATSETAFSLVLRMKNKLSELPITEFQILHESMDHGDENAGTKKSVSVVSLSGCYGENESILLWKKVDENESTIWTNRALDFSKRKPLFQPSSRTVNKVKNDLSELAIHQTLARESNRSSNETIDSLRKKAESRRKSLF